MPVRAFSAPFSPWAHDMWSKQGIHHTLCSSLWLQTGQCDLAFPAPVALCNM